jgi:hypothetical protein
LKPRIAGAVVMTLLHVQLHAPPIRLVDLSDGAALRRRENGRSRASLHAMPWALQAFA